MRDAQCSGEPAVFLLTRRFFFQFSGPPPLLSHWFGVVENLV